MWNNGSSRRGRRMSIDLPNLHLNPNNGSDGSSYPSSNYFPMGLPLAFMNGKCIKCIKNLIHTCFDTDCNHFYRYETRNDTQSIQSSNSCK